MVAQTPVAGTSESSPSIPELGARARGWLKFLYRKCTTVDDWSEDGEPHPWWDRYSGAPMTNFPRFDVSESTYALVMMADVTPAWREVYTRIADELVARHTTFWAAVDWLTQFGHDPQRAQYPEGWKGSIVPEHLWGRYDSPGWTANGIEPWGLQKDPIGADGNLFFRGFFNLVLSSYRYVSGDDKWNEPFDVAGVDRSRYEWSHERVAEFLSSQWESRPEGPHCENTKIWPYCLSAAGLGLKLFDGVVGTDHHRVFEPWTEHCKEHYMVLTDDGRLQSIALYYDPIEEHAQGQSPVSGLGPAFYMVPQNRSLAELLYRAGVEALGWRNPDTEIPSGSPRIPAVVLTLAREFGDREIEDRLRALAEERFEPRSFGDQDSEFGYWFGLEEDYPRGQYSGLVMCADVGERGAWSRVFNGPNLRKFDQPTVTGVDFPALGISAAYNDEASGVLRVRTYAGEPSKTGATTTFRVEQLAQTEQVLVRRNGELYPRVRVVSGSALEIEAEIGEQEFEVVTRVGGAARLDQREPVRRSVSGSLGASSGASGASSGASGASSGASGASGAPSSAGVATSASAIRAANRLVATGAGGCPCCVAT